MRTWPLTWLLMVTSFVSRPTLLFRIQTPRSRSILTFICLVNLLIPIFRRFFWFLFPLIADSSSLLMSKIKSQMFIWSRCGPRVSSIPCASPCCLQTPCRSVTDPRPVLSVGGLPSGSLFISAARRSPLLRNYCIRERAVISTSARVMVPMRICIFSWSSFFSIDWLGPLHWFYRFSGKEGKIIEFTMHRFVEGK